MGTGLLAALNRNGAITPLVSYVDQVKRRLRLTQNVAEGDAAIRYDNSGVLCSVSHLTEVQKASLANKQNYQSRAEIALDVASHYPGGDYFEFGCMGLATFRNFLAAFEIFHPHTKNFPSTKFYAFDIFGNPDQGSGPPSGEREYFEYYRNPSEVAAPLEALESYGDLKDRSILVPGYFQDTLNEAFKQRMRATNQRIGFAFSTAIQARHTKWSLTF
jgi:hypothetical protein